MENKSKLLKISDALRHSGKVQTEGPFSKCLGPEVFPISELSGFCEIKYFGIYLPVSISKSEDLKFTTV
jgi:hypothetical protein